MNHALAHIFSQLGRFYAHRSCELHTNVLNGASAVAQFPDCPRRLVERSGLRDTGTVKHQLVEELVMQNFRLVHGFSLISRHSARCKKGVRLIRRTDKGEETTSPFTWKLAGKRVLSFSTDQSGCRCRYVSHSHSWHSSTWAS